MQAWLIVSTVSSFHLMADPPRRWPSAWRRLAFDRYPMSRIDGLKFVRVLGTGRGHDVSRSVDPGRTAVFAHWRDTDAFQAFRASSRVSARWGESGESWHCLMYTVRSTGQWQGAELAGCRSADVGPVLVLTRASIRWRHRRSFRVASTALARSTENAEGLVALAGIGERPWGTLGTFSVWSSEAAAAEFAQGTAHAVAQGQASDDRWFGESMFAVFSPIASWGTWSGVDPLGGAQRA